MSTLDDRPAEGAPLPVVEHPTMTERADHGKETRRRIPRSSHAGWEPSEGRAHPMALLERQATTRLPELVPLRYERMLASPFTFYRGAAIVMAADLARAPRTDLTVQLCGDAHLLNFGIFAGPDRRLVFSLNDFDETLPGPFEWDVKRFVASVAIAGRSRGFSRRERTAIELAVVRSYREAMHEFATMNTLQVWYARLDIDGAVAEFGTRATQRQRRNVGRIITKARSKDSLRALGRLTHVVDGQRRFISDPPLIVPIEELLDEQATRTMDERIARIIRSYSGALQSDRRVLLERYRFVHLARKVVGVGSVGTRAWVVLLVGRDDGDPLVLQMKEAQPSVLEEFAGPSVYDNEGERVVAGQRLMQSASDILLGWFRTDGIDGVQRDFYVRQLWDGKGSVDIEAMNPLGLTLYGEMCGWTLARAHARSGDSAAIAGYLGRGDNFDRAMAAFAEDYAEQNERDFDAVRAALSAQSSSAPQPA